MSKMSIVSPSAAVTALSELSIDVEKDWDAKRITNLGAPTASSDAARKNEVDTVQTNVDTHTALTASVHGGSASGFEDKANKNVASGYAGLDASILLSASQIPTIISRIASGSYVGTSTANKDVAHGLGGMPKVVVIVGNNAGAQGQVQALIIEPGYIHGWSNASVRQSVTAPDATKFYVGNAGSYAYSANFLNDTYYWVACR